MQNTEIFSQNTESFFMGCTGLGTSFESDREGGAESLWNRFFSVTRGRSATSTFCTYCGGCSVPRHIYIYCIAIIKSNQIYLDTAYLKMTQGCLQLKKKNFVQI